MYDHPTEANFGADRMSVIDYVYDDGDNIDSTGDNTVMPVVLSQMVRCRRACTRIETPERDR